MEKEDIMHTTKLIALLLVLALTAVGCTFGRQARKPGTVPKVILSSEDSASLEDPCREHLDDVSVATSDAKATQDIREWLNCVASTDGPPPLNLKKQVAEVLALNPYPGTRRRSQQILAHFFDKKQLRNLPETRRRMESYIELLDDQALRARAEGDDKMAKAAEARAKSLTTLSGILTMLDEDN